MSPFCSFLRPTGDGHGYSEVDSDKNGGDSDTSDDDEQPLAAPPPVCLHVPCVASRTFVGSLLSHHSHQMACLQTAHNFICLLYAHIYSQAKPSKPQTKKARAKKSVQPKASAEGEPIE